MAIWTWGSGRIFNRLNFEFQEERAVLRRSRDASEWALLPPVQCTWKGTHFWARSYTSISLFFFPSPPPHVAQASPIPPRVGTVGGNRASLDRHSQCTPYFIPHSLKSGSSIHNHINSAGDGDCFFYKLSHINNVLPLGRQHPSTMDVFAWNV